MLHVGLDLADKTAFEQRLEVQDFGLCEASTWNDLDDSLMVDRMTSNREAGAGSGSMGKTSNTKKYSLRCHCKCVACAAMHCHRSSGKFLVEVNELTCLPTCNSSMQQ